MNQNPAPQSKTVQISPEVEIEEQAALIGFLRNRSIIQAQGIADLRAMNAELQRQLQELQQQAIDAADPKRSE